VKIGYSRTSTVEQIAGLEAQGRHCGQQVPRRSFDLKELKLFIKDHPEIEDL
jgi:hypothetical protein